ncbi:MAG: hypothetical protein FWD65_06065 [Coriobacteriia bacterium]|nr:hypothetical protein [Coriobacteriia bacterium]
MCTDGVNHNQLQMMLEMCQAEVELIEDWVKELAHLAGHAGLEAESSLSDAITELKSVRRRLDRATEEVENTSNFPEATITAV